MRRFSLLFLAALAVLLVPQVPAAAAPLNQYQAPETGWTSVFREFPDQTNWNGANLGADGRAGVGHTGTFTGHAVTARSFFQFDVGALRGKRVAGAELTVWNSHSASCSASTISLWGTAAITPATTWHAQPQRTHLQDRYLPGGGERCGGTVPVTFDVTAHVAQLAAAGVPEATFGLAGNEFDQWAWRKFDTSRSGVRPQLNIRYE